MKRQLSILLGAAVLLAGGFAARADDQANSPEARLRDALKNTMLQLRTVTTQNDNLQAQVNDLQAAKDDLTKQLTDLKKATAKTQADDMKTIAELKRENDSQTDSIATLHTTLDQWKDAQRKAVQIANDTEAKRVKLADLSIRLQRVVDDQKRKNDEMLRLGLEVLNRYEKYGLGQAITAKEPFLGITRAKFQALVQDYEDKLTDQRITDSPTPTPGAAPKPSPDPKKKQ
jgi:uncharacterized protein (DUF3084 family)